MVTFLWTYLGIGVLFSWICMEAGHHEAKSKGMTLHQLHKESIKNRQSSKNVLTEVWMVLVVLAFFWFIILAGLIYKVFNDR